MSKMMSRSAFARLAGVTPAAITIACRTELEPACDGDRVDADHPIAIAYLERRNTRVNPGPPPKAKSAPRDDDAPTETTEDIERYAALTLRELVEKFGTERKFRDWLAALKTIEDIRRTRLDNDETERRLISRELVKTHIFAAIDGSFRRLLSDAPKTIARRVFALAKSGGTVEEAERTIREIMSSQLSHLKAKASRVLRNA